MLNKQKIRRNTESKNGEKSKNHKTHIDEQRTNWNWINGKYLNEREHEDEKKMMKLFNAHTYNVYTEAHYLSLKHVNGEQYLFKRQLKNDFLIIYLSFRILLEAINKLNKADVYSTIMLRCVVMVVVVDVHVFHLGRGEGREASKRKGLISVPPNDGFMLLLFIMICSRTFLLEKNQISKAMKRWKQENRMEWRNNNKFVLSWCHMHMCISTREM